MALPSLPAGVTRKALKAFVRAGLARAGYGGIALARAISDYAIVRVTDATSGESRLEGFVRISPARAGIAAIEALRGLDLLGHPVQVQRYSHRAEFGVDGGLKVLGRDGGGGHLRFDLVDD